MKKLVSVVVLLFLAFGTAFAKSPQGQKVEQIFKAKCMDCHSMKTEFPWYFKIPIAKDIIMNDVNRGRKFFNLEKDLFNYERDKDIPKHVVQALKSEITYNSMPPLQYKLAHWDKVISFSEKELILDWLEKLAGSSFKALPTKASLNLNKEKVVLGKKLFHDKRLSADNSLSCASCHDLAKGGTDQARFSTGINGAKGHINSPTVYNSVFNILQFWDGRAANLEAQAHGPVHNPIEMGSNWKEVLEKISDDDDLVDSFKSVYKIKRSKHITGDMIANAIAEFEKSLVTPAAFDDYLKGDDDALSAEAKEGFKLFKKYNCSNCHLGVALGASNFKAMGLAKDYFADREKGANGLSAMPLSKEDNGKFNLSHKEDDRHVFKVPTLRNVELTYPYFHDGNVESLEEAVRIMAEYQGGYNLDKSEISKIVSFLKSLTGKSLAK